MRWTMLILLLCGLVANGAGADPTNLEGGMLLAHFVPELVYTSDAPPGGWCQAYLDTYAISSCEEVNCRIDTPDTAPVIWFVLAYWFGDEAKEWCGAEFGFGEYDPRIFYCVEYGACFPGTGWEYSTDGWPGPNEGTAFFVAHTPWVGNWLPVYFFGGYAYASYGPGQIELASASPASLAGTWNCSTPPQFFHAGLGIMGINMDGGGCFGPPNHVCCVGSQCFLIPETACSDLGGEWHPELYTCVPNPCEETPALGTSWGTIKALYR
ncbi:MAG: hypothetical protein KAY24_15800 [Candidatus Eisenbacteria sp.]|nr:hypothetical protein [Candidatus Eisenbacteria bacterium]